MSTFLLTSLHHVIQGWEASVNPGADGAQNQDGRQVGISHERSPQQAAPLIHAVHISRHSHHQVVGQWEASVLTPPAVEGHSDIETCNTNKNNTFLIRANLFSSSRFGPDRAAPGRLTQQKQNWDEVGVGELVTVEGDALKDLLLLWREHKPVGESQAQRTSTDVCREQQD